MYARAIRLHFAWALIAFLATTPLMAQVVANDAYGVSDYTVPGTVRIINTGQIGSPIDVGTRHGTVCANIYVFDANQEMLECCSCPITANGLLTMDVAAQLLNQPLTGVTPDAGVVKVVADTGCNPTSVTSPVPHALAACIVKILDKASPKLVESCLAPAPLQNQEAAFLGNACSFVLYLGSGKGLCACGLAA